MREYVHIARNGQLEMVWKYTMMVNGFQTNVFIRGTEDEMLAYAKSELPYEGSYHAIDFEMAEALGKLGIPVYCAPQF